MEVKTGAHAQCLPLFKAWSPIIRKFQNHPDTEIEFRFGRAAKKGFDTNIGKDTFEKVLKALMKYQEWEKATHSKSTVYYFENDRRLTIDEETDEQVGCVKKRVSVSDFELGGEAFDLRLGVSTEKPWEYDGDEVSTEQKDKERWSFVRKNLSIDVTALKGNPDDKDCDEDTVYQIEMEIIKPGELGSDVEVFNLIYKVFDILKCA
jgi:hypothetical protein